MKNAPDGGVFYFSRITFLQPHRDGVPPPPGRWDYCGRYGGATAL